MQEIKSESLLDEIIKLEPDQRIFIDFPVEVCNKLELLGLQLQSYEKLLQSYINNTSDSANEFNMTKFLNLYTDLAREKDILFKNEILKCFGTAVYNYCMNLSNKAFYFLDSNLKKIVIGKQALFPMNDGKSCSC